MGQRLFDVNVFSWLASQDSRDRVPVIRSRNNNSIEISLFQEVAKIFVSASLQSCLVPCRSGIRVIHVADCAKLDVRNLSHQFGHLATPAATANQAHDDPIVGSKGFAW